MDERFLQWHAGLRVEAADNAFRPFVESNDTGERLYSTQLIRDRADAAVGRQHHAGRPAEGARGGHRRRPRPDGGRVC
jgi:hypothetical protein